MSYTPDVSVCMQIDVDDDVSSNKASGLVRLFHQAASCSFGSLRSKRRVKEEDNINRVGANSAELSQLHMKNSTSYLRHKHQVQAAGESLFLDAV